MRPAQSFWRHGRFWLAAAAALPAWAVLYLVWRPAWNPTWPLAQPLLFLQLALLYPVVEEIVFRGAVQPVIHRWRPAWFGPISFGNALTSLAFAALHLLYHPPLWAFAVIAPSLVFGYFKDRYGSLAAPILLHVLYNAGYYLLLPPLPVPA